MSEPNPTIDQLREILVRVYADMEEIRYPPDGIVDPTHQRWFDACKVLEIAQGLYDAEARRLFAALPISCRVLVTYNMRGQDPVVTFGNRKNTFHIVPLQPYARGALVRPLEQPLCAVMRVKPWDSHSWDLVRHENLPTCHGCLQRAEKIEKNP